MTPSTAGLVGDGSDLSTSHCAFVGLSGRWYIHNTFFNGQPLPPFPHSSPSGSCPSVSLAYMRLLTCCARLSEQS